MILQRVTPVTHSVGNCLKRVIVIVASVIVFQNPMSQKNMIGKLVLGSANGLPLLCWRCHLLELSSAQQYCGCHQCRKAIVGISATLLGPFVLHVQMHSGSR